MFRKRFFMHSLVMNSALLLMLSSNLAGKREYFAQETLLPEDFVMEDLTEEESPDPADLPESYGMQDFNLKLYQIYVSGILMIILPMNFRQ